MADSLLSLVVPAYRQEKTISKDIKSLSKSLSQIPYDYEIIIVVDGYVDETFREAKKVKDKHVKVLGYEDNRGKGFAIKTGVLEAKGDIIGFIDSGMDLDPTEISLMINIMEWDDSDIVIGSKLHPDSIVNYPLGRKIISWAYRMIIKLLFNLNVRDTQVGLKLFKKKVAKDVFPKILVKAFAFDVEVLAVARSLGYDKIHEAPIKLSFKQGSITSTSFWRVAFWMLWDTLAVYYRMNILKHYSKS
jgi:glycosyltransferase involved in cell wall biosynthesis